MTTLGHEARCAYDGPSTLELARSFHPDVALLDLGLPVMDGYELAARLREMTSPTPRLVAVTGYGQPADRERTQSVGFDAHLVEPLDVAWLSRVLDELT